MKKQKVIKVFSSKDLLEIGSIDNEFHKAIMVLLANTGLRVSELTSLNIGSIAFDDYGLRDLLTVKGKGNKVRSIPWNQKAKESIFILLKDSQAKMKNLFTLNSPLIVSKKRTRMSRVQIFRILDSYNKALNLSIEMSPHTFRHQFATTLLRKKAPSRMCKTFSVIAT